MGSTSASSVARGAITKLAADERRYGSGCGATAPLYGRTAAAPQPHFMGALAAEAHVRLTTTLRGGESMRSTVFAMTLLLACTERRPHALLPCTTATERRVASVDQRVSLCLPTDFRATDGSGHAWVRGAASDSSYVFVSVSVLDSAALQELERWPPRLNADARGLPDEVVCESIERTRHPWKADSITVETGLCSGGFGGARSQPTAVAGWRLAASAHVFYQAFAYRPEDLALIRSVAATVTAR